MEFLQTHDLAGLMQGQGIEQDGIHNAEYGGVRPDSKRQGNHGHSRKAGGLPQHAKLVAQVLKQRFHSVQAHPGCRRPQLTANRSLSTGRRAAARRRWY